MNPTTPATQTPATNTPQVGAWVNGQQWNGSAFGAPNVITVGPSAGQTVNPTVVAAGDVAQGKAPGTNEAYLAKVGANPVNSVGVGTNPNTAGATTASDPFNTPEIQAANKAITDRQTALATAQNEINDNPFYSEATRTGKLSSLQSQYLADIAPYQTELTRLTDVAKTTYAASQAAAKTSTSIQDIDGVSTAVTLDASGNIVNKVPIGPSGKGTGDTFDITSAVQSMAGEITPKLNSYGNIGPDDFMTAEKAWVDKGGKVADFIKYFGKYADTNRGDFEQAYGFKNPKPTWVGNTYVGKTPTATTGF